MSITSSSPWPEIEGGAIAFLLDARDEHEARLLRDWAEAQKPAADPAPPHVFITLPRARAGKLLDTVPAEYDAVWMQPLRIAWLPSPRTPLGKARRRWLAKHRPERVAYIVGDGAWLDELRERVAGSDDSISDDELSEFVTSQALIALERSERSVRGARYKVPRILPSDVFANTDFRNLLANVAQQRDRSPQLVHEQAARYLREMAATQTPLTIETMNALYRTACHSHHDAAINVDPAQLERIAATIGSHPVVFLISHKSMLDTMALSLVLFDANLPLPLTFGGINLSKPGLGAFARRAGIIFLRRSFQDNEIYKATFRRYIDYLIEKRFSLLWAL